MNSPALNRIGTRYGWIGCIVLLAFLSHTGVALDFSLTPDSPKVPATFSAADVIDAEGGGVRASATDLGVQSGGDVIGVSYGQAETTPIDTTYFFTRLAYSVDRTSTGQGAPVAPEASTDGAAGDTFALDFVGFANQRFILRRPFLLRKAQTRGLSLLPNEDDIDGFALSRGGSVFPVYATFAAGSGFDPATIYIIRTPGATPEVFATPNDLGLVSGDVIDAFSVGSIPNSAPPPQSLTASVVIWLSLDRASPSRGGGADSIIQAWPAPSGEVLSAGQLNLTGSDEINAIAVLDPYAAGQVIPDDVLTRLSGQGPWVISSAKDAVALLTERIGDDGSEALLRIHSQSGGEWLPLHELVAKTVPGSFGNIRGLAVGAGSEATVLVAQVGGGDWMLGESVQAALGTVVAAVNNAAGAARSVESLSPNNLSIARAIVLEETPGGSAPLSSLGKFNNTGAPLLFLAGDATPTLSLGSMNPDVDGKLFAAFSDLEETGIEGRYVVTLEFSGQDNVGSTPNSLIDADARILDGATSGSKRIELVLAVTTEHRNLSVRLETTSGVGPATDFLDLHPAPDGSTDVPLIVKCTIDCDTDSMTVDYAVPIDSSSLRDLNLGNVVLAEDGAFFSLFSPSNVSLLGLTAGDDQVLMSDSYLFKITDGSPPSAQLVAYTVTPEHAPGSFASLHYDTRTRLLLVTVSTFTFQGGFPFEFDVVCPASGTAAGVSFSRGLGLESSVITIDPSDFSIGPLVVDGDSGTDGQSLFNSVIALEAVPAPGGVRIFVESRVPGGILHPWNLPVPSTPEMPGESAQLLSFVDVSIPIAGLPPQINSLTVDTGGTLILDYTGVLQATDAVENPFSDVPGVQSPASIPPTDPQRFFRTREE